MKYYNAPRWSREIFDCSMPMTFDTYNKCSFNCLYCFSYFQKSHSMGEGGTRKGQQDYQQDVDISWVDIKRIIKLFTFRSNCETDHQFYPYIKDKKIMQWGGLADQFDMYEKKYGITLKLLKVFKKLDYPLCFSTKSLWWLQDERYLELFKDQDNWNCKFSIINLNPDKAKKMEKGVPIPEKRLEAIKIYSGLNKGGATLRLRPFIIGYSDVDDEYLELINLAHKNGATAISTEFFCLEGRADERLKQRYNDMSEIMGFDVFKFYKRYSQGSGYKRLNYSIKRRYIEKMKDLCDKIGMRFYVSDAHHKEKCNNGSCCGLPESWNYSRGQFTEALMIAKTKGKVYFSDISDDIKKYHSYNWYRAMGFNTNGYALECKHRYQSMYDYLREVWNTPKDLKSPYKYFGGVLTPIGLDENKDVIYEYKEI